MSKKKSENSSSLLRGDKFQFDFFLCKSHVFQQNKRDFNETDSIAVVRVYHQEDE